MAFRTTCALLVPYLFGGLCHMLFCRQNLTADGLLPKLWETGKELLSGGVLSGDDTGRLAPGGAATRAEVAQIFMNYCEKIAK